MHPPGMEPATLVRPSSTEAYLGLMSCSSRGTRMRRAGTSQAMGGTQAQASKPTCEGYEQGMGSGLCRGHEDGAI